MVRVPSADAKIAFLCKICNARKEGLPEDTLWFETADVKEGERYQIMLERASYDPAAKTVPIECECGRQYMTLVRIGKSAVSLYVCECGARRNFEGKKIISTESVLP